MAVPYPGTNTPLLNRYTNNDGGGNTVESNLPSGKCNFTNLSVGGNAPRCGCRRFWDKALGDGTQRSAGRSGFCMCEHHACFHDDVPEVRISGELTIEGTPKLSAAPQTPQKSPGGQSRALEAIGRPQESNIPDTLQWGRYIHSASPMGGLPAIPSQCLLPSEAGSMTSSSQARYYRPFGGLGLETLSHIPVPVTGNTPNQENKPSEDTRMQIYEDANGNGFLQSLTEVATPSVRASEERITDADFSMHCADVQDVLGKLGGSSFQARGTIPLRTVSKEDPSSQIRIKQSASHPGDSLIVPPESEDGYLIPKLKSIIGHLSGYPTKMIDHQRRLELLENASFSNAAIEELQDADDRIDTRVGDLEERVVELEKAHAALNDVSSVGSRHLVDGSFDSRASHTSSAMIAEAIDRVDSCRVEALEAQIAELQAAAPPSHSRPWEFEVVFLPFGFRLMGIWSHQHGMTQRSRLNSAATDEWTQTQHSIAAAQALMDQDQASAWENFTTNSADENDASWLMAKACGMGSRINERLRSRGLIKTIQILGPDARDVQAAIMAAFGDLPTTLVEDPYSQSEDENAGAAPKALRKYLGLQSAWIPLRKLHKDSCLRFLNPSEMVTPALWTAQFLASSVVMKRKQVRRLFVTQRDSYIQHLGHHTADWTWAKLRQLPRFYPNQASFTHTPEADAHEPCWEFDERLDPAHESIHSSFASHISSLSIRSVAQEEEIPPASPSDHFSSAEAASRNVSTTPTSVAPTGAPPSPLKERNPFRPVHGRTTSMPTSIPIKLSQPPTKRRIASFDHDPQSSPALAPSVPNFSLHLSGNANLKRRRISRSPSRPRDTPRYSAGPPSPFTFMDADGRRDKERGMTPFAYATPYSNAPYVEKERYGFEDGRGGVTDEEAEGGEDRALSDYDDGSVVLGSGNGGRADADEEWEGVGAASDREDEDGGDDGASEASSSPSEYPSHLLQQRREELPLFSGTKSGFRIHVDEGELV